MRIALVTVSFLPRIGGAEFVVHHLGQQWRRDGHDVCVFNTVTDVATEPDALYEVKRYKPLRGTTGLGAHRWPFAAYAGRVLERAVLAYEADVISAHFGYPTAVWLSKSRSIPKFLITCHGPALNKTPQGPRQRYGIDSLVADALNASHAAIAISHEAAGIMKQIGVHEEKIHYIPNGADLSRFKGRVTSIDLRARFGLPAGARVVLSVGRESWAKAYDVGLRAFTLVARELGDAYYVILGRGTGRWQAVAEEFGVGNRVVTCEGLYGDELIGAYQQADVFFLPSKKELCPVVVPEAMAAGLPEVVTNISGSQDMIVPGENGFVVEPGDWQAMGDALIALLENPAERERIGKANLALSADYDWGRIGQRYLECAMGK